MFQIKRPPELETSIKLHLFETIHVLLEDFQCSTIIPCLMILFQYTQILAIVLYCFETGYRIFLSMFLYIIPHKMGISFYFYVFSMIGVSIICSLIIVFGMYQSYKLRGRKIWLFIMFRSISISSSTFCFTFLSVFFSISSKSVWIMVKILWLESLVSVISDYSPSNFTEDVFL